MFDIYVASEGEKSRFIIGKSGKNLLVTVGLNPSTANLLSSDTTATRIERVSELNGYDGFAIINLYPQRSTNPDGLHRHQDKQLISENLKHIRRLLSGQKKPHIWAAWGGDIQKRRYLADSLHQISRVVSRQEGEWFHYGALRKDGHPRHPSRLSYEWQFCSFDIDTYLAVLA